MVNVLLDTNILSELGRPYPNEELVRRIGEHSGRMSIASVTLHEVIYGIELLPDGRRKEAVKQYFHNIVLPLHVLPYDKHAADCHARERARLESVGKRMPYADGQIAAVAIVHSLTLITANVKDFSNVRALRTANWLARTK
jgi:tRNA(fMet)-specific endonuclease VapC